MDPITGAALTVTMLAVWTYVTYFAVRRGVRDGLRDRDVTRAEARQNEE